MTWRIEVKPTSHLLTQYTWTAQGSDGESYLFSESPLSTSEQALTQAQQDILTYEQRRKIVRDNTVTIEAYEAPIEEAPAE